METFTVLVMVFAIAYAWGTVCYQFLGFQRDKWYQVLPFAVTGVLVGEALWAGYFVAGPAMLGIHPVVALFAIPVAITADLMHRGVGIGAFTQNFRNGPTTLHSVEGGQKSESDQQRAA